jgi:hypothetical protein
LARSCRQAVLGAEAAWIRFYCGVVPVKAMWVSLPVVREEEMLIEQQRRHCLGCRLAGIHHCAVLPNDFLTPALSL